MKKLLRRNLPAWMKNPTIQRRLLGLLLYGIVFLVHAVVAVQMNVPHMSHDEIGVLASAAYVTGEDWSGIVSNIGYYGYGTSLLYIPIFFLTKGPILRYRLIALLNAAYLSLIPVIAFYLLVRYLGMNRKPAFPLALATGLYPGYLVYTKWVWNESMMCFLPWLMLLFLVKLYHAPNKPRQALWGVLLALTLVYSYTVHGRALAFFVAVFLIVLVVLVAQRRCMVEPISFLLSLGGFYVLSNFGKQFFVQHVWLAQSAGELNNTLGGTVGGVKSLLNLSGIKGLIKIAIGQLFAANASAYGILTLAVVLAVPIIWNGCKKNMRLTKQRTPDGRHTAWLLALFQLLLFLGAFGISILFLGNHGSAAVTRGDYFIYTRYISNVLGICLFFALYAVLRHAYRLRLLAVAGILFAGNMLSIFLLSDTIQAQADTSNTTILNLIPYIGKNPYSFIASIDFRNLVLVVSLVFCLVLLGIRTRKQGGLHLILCGVFLQSYAVTAHDVILENSRADFAYVHTAMHIVSQVDQLESHYPDVYYYNVHQLKPFSGSAMQFVLPDAHLKEFDFEIRSDTQPQEVLDFISENSLIISSEDLNLEAYDAHIYRLDHTALNRNNEYFWVYGDAIRDYILENSSLQFVPTTAVRGNGQDF